MADYIYGELNSAVEENYRGVSTSTVILTVDNILKVISAEVSDLSGFISAITVAEYSSESTYHVGDIVVYKSKLYKCLEDIFYPEEFIEQKWQQITLIDLIQQSTASGLVNVRLENNNLIFTDNEGHEKVIDISSYENVIESISVNGVEQSISNKNVDIFVPTKTSDITNDSDFTTNAHVASIQETLQGKIDSEELRAKGAESALGTRIDDLDLAQVGESGSYIKFVSQSNGQVNASKESFDISLSGATDSNAPTSKAVKDYADAINTNLGSAISAEEIRAKAAEKNVSDALDSHKNNKSNPHEVSKSQVGLSDVVNTGDTATPAENSNLKFTAGGAYSLKQDLTSSISSVEGSLSSHVGNKNNPHEVTKSQVGLGNVQNTGDSATPTEDGTAKFTTGGAYTLKTNLEKAVSDEETRAKAAENAISGSLSDLGLSVVSGKLCVTYNNQ